MPKLDPDKLVFIDESGVNIDITGKRFLTFLKQTLFPVLPKERNLFYRQILWSIMKTFLRNWKIRVVKLLRNSVKAAIFRIVISVCQGWFFLSGY